MLRLEINLVFSLKLKQIAIFLVSSILFGLRFVEYRRIFTRRRNANIDHANRIMFA